MRVGFDAGIGQTVRLDADGHPFYLYGDVKVPVDKDTPQVSLHDDPGFEAQTAGVLDDWNVFWQVNGSAVSTTAEAMAESRSARVVLSAAGSQALVSSSITVQSGDVIKFWVFAVRDTGSPTIRLDLLTRAGGLPDYFDEPDTDQQTGATHTLTDTYAKYEQEFTVLGDHTVARASFVVEAPAAASAHVDSSGSLRSRTSAVENVFTQTLLPANVNITGTSGAATTLTGLSRTLDSPGVSAVYAVEIDACLTFGVTLTDCVVELLVDGVAATGAIRQTGLSSYEMTHRVWRVTGLSPGSHTFSARGYNAAGGLTTVAAQDHTVMTVTRQQ